MAGFVDDGAPTEAEQEQQRQCEAQQAMNARNNATQQQMTGALSGPYIDYGKYQIRLECLRLACALPEGARFDLDTVIARALRYWRFLDDPHHR